MTRANNCPYQCPRCGYEHKNAFKMKVHFAKKRPCAANLRTIELTDEIKEQVMRDRIYRDPQPVVQAQPQEPAPNQNITIYNQQNTFNIETLYQLGSAVPVNYLVEGFAKKTNKQIESIENFVSRGLGDLVGKIGANGESPNPTVKLEDFPKMWNKFNWIPNDKKKGEIPCIISDPSSDKPDEFYVNKGENKYVQSNDKETMRLIIQCSQLIFFKEYETYLLDMIEKYPIDHPDNIFATRAFYLLKDYYTILQAVDLEPILDKHEKAWSEAQMVPDVKKQVMCCSMLESLRDKSKTNTKHVHDQIMRQVMGAGAVPHNPLIQGNAG